MKQTHFTLHKRLTQKLDITFKIKIGYVRAHSRLKCASLVDIANITMPENFNVANDNLDLHLEDMIAEDGVIEYLFKELKGSKD